MGGLFYEGYCLLWCSFYSEPMLFQNTIHSARLKICGITRLEDALLASDLGVDAVGFVFYEKSPRYIKPQDAALIIKQLPPFMSVVGLFVNPSQEEIDGTLEVCALDIIQLHGDESPAFCMQQKRRVIKALAIAEDKDLKRVADYGCAVLLDAKAPDGVYGGVGKQFDWAMLHDLQHGFPLLLAGGIDEGNIAQALQLRDWYAVDVSSGVESAKGVKDRVKMKALCNIMQMRRCKENR